MRLDSHGLAAEVKVQSEGPLRAVILPPLHRAAIASRLVRSLFITGFKATNRLIGPQRKLEMSLSWTCYQAPVNIWSCYTSSHTLDLTVLSSTDRFGDKAIPDLTLEIKVEIYLTQPGSWDAATWTRDNLHQNPSSLQVIPPTTEAHTCRHSRIRSQHTTQNPFIQGEWYDRTHATVSNPSSRMLPRSKHPALCRPPFSGRPTSEMDGRQLICR